MPLTNRHIAELLARMADETEGHRRRAYTRAAHAALTWTEEAAGVLEDGRALTELHGIGPSIATRLRGWIESPPADVDPPPHRRGFMTRTEARDVLDAHPEWRGVLRGDLQMHTTFSDGGATARDMAATAISIGHSYIAITDHSKGLAVAGGMNEARLGEQGLEIAELNDEIEAGGSSFRVLTGIEMNISPEGEGDMEPDALAALDLVIGSFHSALRRTTDQTERYLSALRNPHVDVLGHPRGRRYNGRAGLDADWERVFAEAAATGTAVEIDGFPERQDLDATLAAAAADAGAWISIGTDSHAPQQMAVHLEFALAIAAAAGLPPHRVLNAMSVDELRQWVTSRRAAT